MAIQVLNGVSCAEEVNYRNCRVEGRAFLVGWKSAAGCCWNVRQLAMPAHARHLCQCGANAPNKLILTVGRDFERTRDDRDPSLLKPQRAPLVTQCDLNRPTARSVRAKVMHAIGHIPRGETAVRVVVSDDDYEVAALFNPLNVALVGPQPSEVWDSLRQ